MVIETPDIQAEVRGFLEDKIKTYTEIFEEIHANYRAQTAGEDIYGVLGGSMTTYALMRCATVDKVKSKRDIDIEKGWGMFHFPTTSTS